MATSTYDLTPNYVSVDFYSLVERLRNQIKESDKFTDIDYEGSNLNVLIELFAYISELNLYYLNQLANNQFIDTTNLYENTHRLSNLLGYNPKGYVSATGKVTITISGITKGETLYVDSWTQLITNENIIDENGEQIQFITTSKVYGEYNYDNTYVFNDIPIRQGVIVNLEYTGSDIIDNKLYLPINSYAYDNNLLDEESSIRLFINGEEWTRTDNFYDKISGLTRLNTSYRFLFDKYKMYYIEFNEYKTVPSSNDVIEIKLLKSLGKNGNVGFNTISQYSEDLHDGENFFIINETTGLALDPNSITMVINNTNSITGGTNPESMALIKENTKKIVNAQYRNVTKSDYITYLENHSEIVKANVWGEQDIYPDGGNFYDYNKIYISLLPSEKMELWIDRINTKNIVLDNGTILYIPIETVGYNSYYQNYISTIAEYLEPRKIICVYEQYVAPDLIYFRFDISIKIKPNYKYDKVLNNLKLKLQWYFNIKNRYFNETIYFTDIINSLMDQNFIDEENNEKFTETAGLINITIRNIKFYDKYTNSWLDPYLYDNEENNYPKYTRELNENWLNDITNVELYINQFPMVDINGCQWNQL